MNLRPYSLAAVFALCASAAQAAPIDRHALVTRHTPTITRVDESAPFMVGNGNFAFTADITGLQTFPGQYSPLVPLMTQSSWGWHSFPNPKGYTLEPAMKPLHTHHGTRKYASLSNWDEAKAPDIQWLRENPHKINLARIALHLQDAAGKRATFADLSDTRQTLDLWSGGLVSNFNWQGAPVEVETSVYPYRDILIVRIKSPLLADGRVGVDLKFPGVSHKLNPDPADWDHAETHTSKQIAECPGGMIVEHRIDGTAYRVRVMANHELRVTQAAPHEFRTAAPGATEVTWLFEFTEQLPDEHLPQIDAARDEVASWWKNFWTRGGAVDFTGSKDPRAFELERRIVLSQYLTAVNSAGLYPPQEEGLFSNSWNGKFHLEMHAWHEAHFAVWGRPDLLERSMPWYAQHLQEAKQRAKSMGVKGAWWPKMVGPEGRESPSPVNPFIMWQQPHPIYLSEVLYDAHPDAATLAKYKDLVFATADMLASWAYYDRKTRRYVLGPPMIPAQENFDPLTTFNPTFELAYWRFGIETAQQWRLRLGMKRNPRWDDVLARLSELPQKDGVYLAAESQRDLWERARSPQCSKGRTASDCPNRDHPSFLAALGYLPGWNVNRETMRRTLKTVVADWDLRQTWGWDWPMLAMTATRLHEPRMAINFLLTDARNFQFGPSGMTPRVYLDVGTAPLVAGDPDDIGYQRAAETYFPSNGALLLAVGLMVAGGQGAPELNPGFPQDGNWIVHSEGITPPP